MSITKKSRMNFKQLRQCVKCCIGLSLLPMAIYLSYDLIFKKSKTNIFMANKWPHKQSKLGPKAFASVSKNEVSQTCIHPRLPVWNSKLKDIIKPARDPIICDVEENWVYTYKGRIFINEKAARKHGKIYCAYAPIAKHLEKDEEMIWKAINAINGSRLVSDAFHVKCKGRDSARYENVHACIAPNVSIAKCDEDPTIPNVLMFGFDSMSRQSVKRLLPKTHAYFTNVLHGQLLEGYNIVGDGTPQALMPILTGKKEIDIQEVRRGKPEAKMVDEVLHFIWKDYENKGYVTQWGEDMAHIGTFNYRMLGFKKQPVHHYMRPFQLSTLNIHIKHKRNCLGSIPKHKVFLNWLKESFVTNKGKPLFVFGFYSELSHNDNNPIAVADDDYANFFTFLNAEGYLNNTILIFMSDHGNRICPLRLTEQGKLEERMPYFGFSFPTMFKETFPLKIKAFNVNTKRLSTPFDIYETLLDIVAKPKQKQSKKQHKMARGLSLFNEIPKERTCADAEIEPHWCACLNYKEVSVVDTNVVTSCSTIIQYINGELKPFLNICFSLKLNRIIKSRLLETNEQLLKFNGSSDNDGRVPEFSDKLNLTSVLYQVTFETIPGYGIFEATVTMNLKWGQFETDTQSISRLNKYGDAPRCISDKHPRLRPYCVCK